MLSLALTLASVLVAPTSFPGEDWRDGVAVNSLTSPACHTNIPLQLGVARVGELVDVPAAEPKVGHTTYVRLVWTNVGNPCAGASFVLMRLMLPPSVFVDLRPGFPIRCRLGAIAGTPTEHLGGTPGCPSAPAEDGLGRLVLDTFVVPNQSRLEILVPIAAAVEGNGGGGSPTVFATFDYGDGLVSGVLTASKALHVFPNPAEIYADVASGVTSHEAHLEALIENHFRGGQAFVDVGETDAFETLTLGPIPVPGNTYAYGIYADLRDLSAATTYRWRVRFVDVAGVETVGPDQTFRTDEPARYALRFEANDGGSIAALPAQDRYEAGSTVSVTAEAAPGYRFVRYLVDGQVVSTAPELALRVSGPHWVRAIFAADDAEDTGDAGPEPPARRDGAIATPSPSGTLRGIEEDAQLAASGGCTATGGSASPLGVIALGLLIAGRRPRRR